jgi:molybdopterin synthase sulfur carrier subunit
MNGVTHLPPGSRPGEQHTTVRWFAAARSATGVAEERWDPAPDTLADLLAAAVERHGAPLAAVLPRCSFLLDGVALTGREPEDVRLAGVGLVDVLPPFAGG